MSSTQSAPNCVQVTTAAYTGPLVRSMEVSRNPGDSGAVLQHPSGYGVIVRLGQNPEWDVSESGRRHSMGG